MCAQHYQVSGFVVCCVRALSGLWLAAQEADLALLWKALLLRAAFAIFTLLSVQFYLGEL